MIVWIFQISLVGVVRELPLQKCPYYFLQSIKEMVKIKHQKSIKNHFLGWAIPTLLAFKFVI
jgi:hypothetical protein